MADAPWIRTNQAAIALLGSKQITATDLAVLVAIASHADFKTPRDCWPALDTLAAETAFHKTTVIRSIARLQKSGLLKIENRITKNGQTKSNRYILVDDVPETLQTTIQEGSTGATEGSTGATEGSTGATQTRSIEQDPRNETVVCKDLVSKKEQIAKLGEISAADLKNAGRLVELQNLAASLGLAREGQRAIYDFFAAAVYAVRSGDDPPRLFCGLLRNGAFLAPVVNVGSEEDAEAGRAMFSAWRRSQTEPHNFARQLAADLFLMPGAREACR